MSTLKKLLALTLALAMVLSVSVFAGNYSENVYADANLIDEDCAEAVEVLYALNIMTGDDTTGVLKLNPNDPITRAQMVKMLYVILNNGSDNASYWAGNALFTDVADDHWAKGYINWAGAIELVQGNGDGTFAPDAALTTAAAAKMLLTAIGYDADAYGFVGPNWEKNVLAAAYEVGLLAGYEASMTGVAPRQWVAKMVMNALGAYTYLVPTALPGNGFLGNFWVTGGTNAVTNIVTFGEKYLNIKVIEGVLTATGKAGFAGVGTGVTIGGKVIKGTDLSYMDLGEHFRVIAKVTVKDGAETYTAASVRNTGKGVVGYAALKDIAVETVYGLEGNLTSSSHFFTIGDLKADFADFKVDEDTIKRDAVAAVSTNTLGGYVKFAKDLKAAAGTKSTDLVKAVAYDGQIEYIVEVDYSYGVVTEAKTDKLYGAYVKVEDSDGMTVLKYAQNSKLYLGHAIETNDDLAEDYIVKYYKNPNTGKWSMEVLPGVGEVTYGGKTTANVYYFDGEAYYLATEGWMTAGNMKWSKKDVVDVVYDDNLVVAVSDIDKTIKTLDEVNAQLALIYDYRYLDDVHFSDGTSEKIYTVYYMDAEGNKKTAEYALDYNVSKTSYVPGETLTGWVDAGWRLFILHTETDGTVWAEELKAGQVNTQLNVSNTVIDAYTEDKTVKVDTKKNTIYKAGVRIAEIDEDVALFVRTGASKYSVTTLAEIRDSVCEDTLVQILTKENTKNVPVVKAGYIDLSGLAADASTNGYIYLAAEEQGYVVAGTNKYDVAEAYLSNKKTVSNITVEMAAGVEPSAEKLYTYTYSDGVYALTEVEISRPAETHIIDEMWTETDSFRVVNKNTENSNIKVVDKQVVVLSTFVIDLDEAVDKDETIEMIEAGELAPEFQETVYTTFDELPESIIDGKEDEGTYYFVSEHHYDANVFYVCLYMVKFPAAV